MARQRELLNLKLSIDALLKWTSSEVDDVLRGTQTEITKRFREEIPKYAKLFPRQEFGTPIEHRPGAFRKSTLQALTVESEWSEGIFLRNNAVLLFPDGGLYAFRYVETRDKRFLVDLSSRKKLSGEDYSHYAEKALDVLIKTYYLE